MKPSKPLRTIQQLYAITMCSLLLLITGDCRGDFSGNFNVVNWTAATSNGGDGFVDTAGAPGSISMTSSDNSVGSSDVTFLYTATANGTAAFAWNYLTSDGPVYDPFGYLINGSFTQLVADGGGNAQLGTAAFLVSIGDIFGFSQYSTDTCCGSATTIISNFSFSIDLPPAATVPATGTQREPIFFVTDTASVASSLFSSVPTAIGLRESSFHNTRTGINVFGQRLNRLRSIQDGTSNTIMFQERSPEPIRDGTSNTIVIGEGDGPEVNKKSSKSAKNVLPPSVNVAESTRWEVYTSFNYGNLDMDEDLNFEGLRSDTYSSGIGAEYALTPYLTLGTGVSYVTSDVRDNDSGNTDVEGFTFVGYASAYWKGIYADLLYGATFLENDIDRDTGLGSTAHAEPNSVVQSVNFNTGYNFTLGQLVTGPYAGIDYAYSDIDGYTEHGGGAANTRVSGQTNHSLLTRLGWQASYNIVKPWGKITPQINAGWERENLNSGDDVTVGLVQSPFYRVQGNSIRSAGGSFSSTVASPGRAQDYLTAGAALIMEVGTRFNVVLDYQGLFFAEGFTAHYAGIKIGYKF